MFIKFIHDSSPESDQSPYDFVEVEGFEKMPPDDDGDIYLRLSKNGHEYGCPRKVTGMVFVMNNEGETIDRVFV